MARSRRVTRRQWRSDACSGGRCAAPCELGPRERASGVVRRLCGGGYAAVIIRMDAT